MNSWTLKLSDAQPNGSDLFVIKYNTKMMFGSVFGNNQQII